MTTFASLREILNDADTLSALREYYARTWDGLLKAFAVGIARPGSARARALISRLREIVATLDPRKDTYVRHWIRQFVLASFITGAESGLAELPGKPKRLPPVFASDTIANAVGTLTTKFSLLASQIQGSLILALHLAHSAILSDLALREGLTDGILRNAIGRQVTADLQEIALEGVNPVTALRLQRNGVSRTVIDALDRINRGVLNIGRAAVNVTAYVEMVAQDVLVSANNTASLAVADRNDVGHVYVERCVKRNICAFCLVVQYNVFYNGPLEKDPAGFPRLRDLPPGPPWHYWCGHGLLPWPIQAKSEEEISRARAKALAIPAEFYGPAGTVEKINHGAGDFKHLRKLA